LIGTSERAGTGAVTSASSLAKSSGAFLPTCSVLVIGQSLLITKWNNLRPYSNKMPPTVTLLPLSDQTWLIC
jgi:hypothetical protein